MPGNPRAADEEALPVRGGAHGRLRWLARGEQGQDLAEYALIFPILIALIAAIIDFAIILSVYSTCANAAREGARAGAVNGGIIPAPTRAYWAEQAALQAIEVAPVIANPTVLPPTVTLTGAGGSVRVTVRGDAKLMTGPIIAAFGGSATVPIAATSIMQIE